MGACLFSSATETETESANMFFFGWVSAFKCLIACEDNPSINISPYSFLSQGCWLCFVLQNQFIFATKIKFFMHFFKTAFEIHNPVVAKFCHPVTCGPILGVSFAVLRIALKTHLNEVMLALFHLLPSNSFSWKEWKNVERLLNNFYIFHWFDFTPVQSKFVQWFSEHLLMSAY